MADPTKELKDEEVMLKMKIEDLVAEQRALASGEMKVPEGLTMKDWFDDLASQRKEANQQLHDVRELIKQAMGPPALTAGPNVHSPKLSSKFRLENCVRAVDRPWVPPGGTFAMPVVGRIDDKDETYLQRAYNTIDGRVTNETVFRGTSGRVTLHCEGDEHKPDLVIYNKFCEAEHGVAAIIELKSPNDANGPVNNPPGETSQEMKQMLGYLHAILHAQKNRAFVIGVLTNHRYMVVAKAIRTPEKIEYALEYAGVFRTEWIQWICEASLARLGLICPKVIIARKKYTLNNYLGSGQYSHGYELKLSNGDLVVVKQFASKEAATNERAVCLVLRGVQGVAQLHASQPTDLNFVAITPKGLPFDSAHPIRKEHVVSLRGSLIAMHKKGKVHGDICPSNIYFLDSTHALLNDWSHVKDADNTSRNSDFFQLQSAVLQLTTNNYQLAYMALGLADRDFDTDEPPQKSQRTEGSRKVRRQHRL